MKPRELRRNAFDERAGAQGEFDVGRQSGFHGVGAAIVGSQPIARAERHFAADRRPALRKGRPHEHDSLGVAHFADSPVVGQRFRHDEFAFIHRSIHRHQPHFGQRRAIGRSTGRPRDDADELLRRGIGIGGHLHRAIVVRRSTR